MGQISSLTTTTKNMGVINDVELKQIDEITNKTIFGHSFSNSDNYNILGINDAPFLWDSRSKIKICNLPFRKKSYLHCFYPGNERVIGITESGGVGVYNINDNKLEKTLDLTNIERYRCVGGLFLFSNSKILIFDHQNNTAGQPINCNLLVWDTESNEVTNVKKSTVPFFKSLVYSTKVGPDHYYVFMCKNYTPEKIHLFEFYLNNEGHIDMNCKPNLTLTPTESKDFSFISITGVLLSDKKTLFLGMNEKLRKINIETHKQTNILSFPKNFPIKKIVKDKNDDYLVVSNIESITLIDLEHETKVKEILVAGYDYCVFNEANKLLVKTDTKIITYKLESKKIELRRLKEKTIKIKLTNMTGVSNKIELHPSDFITDVINGIKTDQNLSEDKKVSLIFQGAILSERILVKDCKLKDDDEIQMILS